MYYSQRVFWNANDLSKEVNNYLEGAASFGYAAGDFLYIGSEHPFSHLYFELSAANNLPTIPSVAIWWNNAWEPAVDVIDETAVTGSSFQESGRIIFKTDRDKGWNTEMDSADVSGISGTFIENFYWTRIAWSASMLTSTAINYIGQKFCEDADIFGQYPDLNSTSLMDQWQTGKTDWKEQCFKASEIIAKDLRAQNIIWSKFQIVDYSRLVDPCVHRTAAIIYRGLGQAWFDYEREAMANYNKLMKQGKFAIDLNRDGKITEREKRSEIIWGTR